MSVLKSLISAFSTYSAIPMPNISYKENEGRFTLLFFPFVGFIIGILVYGFNLGCWYLNTPEYIYPVGAIFIPIMVTGGIHLDGFMDSMDAIHSYGSLEKKHEILKDPHIGAFSVIKLVELACIWFIAIALSQDFWVELLCWGFVVSRISSAISILSMDTAKNDGMVFYTKAHSSKACKPILLFALVLIIFHCIYEFEAVAVLPLISVIVCYLFYNYKVKKEFGGITGDTSGCFLVMTETAWILSLMIYSLVNAL